MKKKIIINFILLIFIFTGCDRYRFSWEELPEEFSNKEEKNNVEIFWCENVFYS